MPVSVVRAPPVVVRLIFILPIVPNVPGFLMPVTVKLKLVLPGSDEVKVFIKIVLVDEVAVHE